MVKVSDFGLARDMHTSDYYKVEDKSLGLPIRWMSTEAIQREVFGTESDVVSFFVDLGLKRLAAVMPRFWNFSKYFCCTRVYSFPCSDSLPSATPAYTKEKR